MTEAEYATTLDIDAMVRFILRGTRDVTDRRWRLCLHAYSLHVRHLITRAPVRQAIDTAGRFADGLATREELHEGLLAVRKALSSVPAGSKWEDASRVVLYATTFPATPPLRFNVKAAADNVCSALDPDPPRSPVRSATYLREMTRCCEIFRDLFPYHAPQQSSNYSDWACGDVALVARAIYEEGRFDDMPILADALMDAGCNMPELVAHCRTPGLHTRGCWGVDLLLGLM